MRRAGGVEPERRGCAIPRCRSRRFNEFVELARSKPGQLNFGNPGTGSSIDLTAQKLFQVANIKLANIGYKGQPPALIDLMTNLMHFEIVSLALALPHIKQGKVKPLAVFTEKRVPDLPDVPTIAEAGYPEAAYVPVVRHLRLIEHAGCAGRKNSRGDQQGAAKSRGSASARHRRYPRQADAAGRARRADESGLREADGRGESLRPEAAISFVMAGLSPVIHVFSFRKSTRA